MVRKIADPLTIIFVAIMALSILAMTAQKVPATPSGDSVAAMQVYSKVVGSR